jgi:hypothetical protein
MRAAGPLPSHALALDDFGGLHTDLAAGGKMVPRAPAGAFLNLFLDLVESTP